MTPANPYTTCANGCGIPAKWKVKKPGRTVSLCNGCATKQKKSEKIGLTRTEAEKKRMAEVLDRLGYGR